MSSDEMIIMYMYDEKNLCTVEPPIKDPLRRGHNGNNLFTKDTFQSRKCSFPTLYSGQPLYKGENGWPQRVLYSEVPLYSATL